MKVGDGETEACGGLEAAGGSDHADCGRFEGVVGGEVKSAPVLTAGVGGVGWASEEVVPFENVGIGRVCGDEGWRGGLDRFVFTGELG